MAGYFYTLDLGEKYGAKLQSLAVQASFDDIEAFAAMILADALDSMESCAPAAGASGTPSSDRRSDSGFEGGQDMDDEYSILALRICHNATSSGKFRIGIQDTCLQLGGDDENEYDATGRMVRHDKVSASEKQTLNIDVEKYQA